MDGFFVAKIKKISNAIPKSAEEGETDAEEEEEEEKKEEEDSGLSGDGEESSPAKGSGKKEKGNKKTERSPSPGKKHKNGHDGIGNKQQGKKDTNGAKAVSPSGATADGNKKEGAKKGAKADRQEPLQKKQKREDMDDGIVEAGPKPKKNKNRREETTKAKQEKRRQKKQQKQECLKQLKGSLEAARPQKKRKLEGDSGGEAGATTTTVIPTSVKVKAAVAAPAKVKGAEMTATPHRTDVSFPTSSTKKKKKKSPVDNWTFE